MIKFFPSGDSAFQLKFGEQISEDIHKMIRAFLFALEKESMSEIVEVVPSYADVLIHYNPLQIDYKGMLSKLKTINNSLSEVDLPEARIVRVPVLYGQPYGENMDAVMEHTGFNQDEIIARHSTKTYLVYMLGFTPGFCYLGGMDERIATPRKEIPSQKILAGAVGIAGNQTGIYPIESPGGWQIIGRTPLKLFDTEREDQFLLKAGDYLQFYSITEEEYQKLNEND